MTAKQTIDALFEAKKIKDITSVYHAVDNKYAMAGFGDKFIITPSCKILAVNDHADAYLSILKQLGEPFNVDYPETNVTNGYKLGYSRLILDGMTLMVAGRPSFSQLKELKNIAIENQYELVRDLGTRDKVLYTPKDGF